MKRRIKNFEVTLSNIQEIENNVLKFVSNKESYDVSVITEYGKNPIIKVTY